MVGQLSHDARHDPGHDPGCGITDDREPKASILAPVPHSESQELDVVQPRYSTRGTAPGRRGCWAVNKAGEPCGSARRADSEFCNAHSGHGVAENPEAWSAKGRAAAAENRRRRATLRATLGIQRPNTPKGLLKASVFAESERLVAAALDGALSPEVTVQSRAAHALKLLESVEPTVQATLQMELPSTPEGVDSLSLSQLLHIVEQHDSEASPST